MHHKLVGIIGGLCLSAQLASALTIVNPDYDPANTNNTNGWSHVLGIYPGSWGVDTLNAPGSTGGAMYFGDVNGDPGAPAVYQTLTATADATVNYVLNVSLYDYLGTGDTQGWDYKVSLLTADPGENAFTANALGTLTVDPDFITNNTWTNVTLTVLGSSIPGGEVGKNLMVGAALSLGPGNNNWGYVDHWSLNAIPEPSTVLLMLTGGSLWFVRRLRHK